MTKLKAYSTPSVAQTTEWVFGVTTGTGSEINSNDIVGTTKWPDPSTGASSSSEQETLLVNALGQPISTTDRNGNVHTLGYDILGRMVSDTATTLGTCVDGAVRRLETAYDGQGNPHLFTSFDATTGGNIVNQVKREFNGLGQLTTEWQSHSGAVTGSTPKVQYGYSEMASGANHSRPTSVTYPNGRVIASNYDSGLDSNVSRLSSLSDGATTLEGYEYLGLSNVVERSHPESGIDLSYIKRSGESNGAAGDQYTGLDQFGRIIDQRWLDASTGTSVDRYGYSYDRNGNRTERDNLINGNFDETYSYDGLNQLSNFARSTTRSQNWDYDALGNWDSVTTDSVAETRGHNEQNEITSVSGATTPTYDANSNMTSDETGRKFVYDAWNRLVTVKDSAGVTLTEYRYDAMNRRISEHDGTTTDLYYSAGWQVLEEQVGGVTTGSYVWSPVYIDAMIARDRDGDSNGTLDERLYVMHDANFNVTGLANTSGNRVERFVYDPFGAATVLDASWGILSGSAYAWVYLHQGGRFDELSGLYHFRNRDYSATLGRWNKNDPIEFEAGDLNLFRSYNNSPNRWLDHLGLQNDDPETLPPPTPLGVKYKPIGLFNPDDSLWKIGISIETKPVNPTPWFIETRNDFEYSFPNPNPLIYPPEFPLDFTRDPRNNKPKGPTTKGDIRVYSGGGSGPGDERVDFNYVIGGGGLESWNLGVTPGGPLLEPFNFNAGGNGSGETYVGGGIDTGSGHVGIVSNPGGLFFTYIDEFPVTDQIRIRPISVIPISGSGGGFAIEVLVGKDSTISVGYGAPGGAGSGVGDVMGRSTDLLKEGVNLGVQMRY